MRNGFGFAFGFRLSGRSFGFCSLLCRFGSAFFFGFSGSNGWLSGWCFFCWLSGSGWIVRRTFRLIGFFGRFSGSTFRFWFGSGLRTRILRLNGRRFGSGGFLRLSGSNGGSRLTRCRFWLSGFCGTRLRCFRSSLCFCFFSARCF